MIAIRAGDMAMVDAVWTERSRNVAVGLLILIAVILSGWALKATYAVSMPLAFAIVVAMLVQPLRRRVSDHVPERWDWLGVAAAMLAVVLVILLFFGAIWFSIEMVGGKASQYGQQLQSQWDQIVGWARQNGIPVPQQVAESGGLGSQLASVATSALGKIWHALGFLVLVFFFALLTLLEVDVWREKAGSAFRASRTAAVLDSVDQVSHQVRWYLLIRTVLGLISGVLATVWLLITGVDFAFVWGFLHFLLNYIPNIGSIIAGGLAALFAFVQFGFAWALLVAAGLLVIEQVIGNFVDPKLQGRTLNISPLIVLIAVIFCGWVWGIAGALLAVPLTAVIITACAHVPALRPAALLLSRAPDEHMLMAQTHAQVSPGE